MTDEGQLIRSAAAGDRRAFDALVRLKRERVVRIAYRITGNWDDAVDVSQAVFLRLWDRLGRFDTSRAFDTWLYRIVVNAAIDHHRAERARPTEPLPEGAEVPAATGDPATEMDVKELGRAFRTLARDLPDKQRAAFVLREIEGQSTAEVARILNVTESTVRNHLLQARRTLRAGLLRDFPGLVPGAGSRTQG